MIDILKFEKFVNESLNQSQEMFTQSKNNNGLLSSILEFRTVGMNLPRKSGKTTVLKTYTNSRSALFYDGNRKSFINPLSMSNITENCFRGHMFNGMKYNCFVLDEPDANCFSKRIIPMLEFLIMSNLIATDFHIVFLGTHRY